MDTPDEIYPASDVFRQGAAIASADDYAAIRRRADSDPDAFWLEQADRLDWHTFPTTVSDVSFGPGGVEIRWFEDGVLNLCYNATDRHVAAGHGSRTAFFFEPDGPDGERRVITYADAMHGSIRMANALRELGVQSGDRVMIYMPMAPEAVFAMLGCARIGAVFSVVFGGFSPDAIAGRILDAGAEVIVTADAGRRAGRPVPLKENVDEAVVLAAMQGQAVRRVLVIRHTGDEVAWDDARDVWLDALPAGVLERDCPCVPMPAEAPLFILYTSGSTGTPKGVVHTTGGYGVYASCTHEWVFDLRPTDVFWCTADVGWITGHTYVVFGPLLNGATQVLYEGVPTYPDASRGWEIVDRYGVTILYTAPTAIRALMAAGDEHLAHSSRASLRLLGSVGEPINPEAWRWYHTAVGQGRCPIVDTWWQTETGGILISAVPAAVPQKPGSATLPLPGIYAALVTPEGAAIEGPGEGLLVLTASWPGQARTVWGDHARFERTYFSHFDGVYFTGDGARRDADGYYWITGRVDDVLNISGHRMGTAEVESALVLHPAVAEAAVVGVPHAIKGQGIYAFVTLGAGHEPSETLRADLVRQVRHIIGPVATPEAVQFAPGLPKTRSGKIMRRILRKVACGEHDSLGDVSTLADPSVVDALVGGRIAVG